MIYANGDVYDGSWLNDLKHGYGILENKSGDKYYGHWNEGLKEGQGYYYYSSTGKIYLGEWHEDVPRCGIFTDVDDESIKREHKSHFKAEDNLPFIPCLKLKTPEAILEDSISTVHFVRIIKLTRTKTISELFPPEIHQELVLTFTQKKYLVNDDGENSPENKIPDNLISIKDFKTICLDKLNVTVQDEQLEMMLFLFEKPFNDEIKIDFLLFVRLFYLIHVKQIGDVENIKQDDNNISGFEDDKMREIEMLSNGINNMNKNNNFEYSDERENMEYDEDYDQNDILNEDDY